MRPTNSPWANTECYAYIFYRHIVLYNELLLSGKLVPHLHEIDMTCVQSLELLMPQMMESEGVDEELKARDQMEWVARMNNIKARIEELLFAELIYN